jgi:glycosyltransferase involved in cell wall biosynthesis
VNISYTYIELPSQEVINDLYQTLDIYPIASRYEGGPQALLEAGILGIPCVSRPVGIAEEVLTFTAIGEDIFKKNPEIPNVQHLKTPRGYERFIELLKSVTNG